MVHINRVYTKGGDGGETALIGGQRVSKASERINGYGTVDERNAALGVVRHFLAASPSAERLLPSIARIQNELFNLGCELATPDPERRAASPKSLDEAIEQLEREIDALNDELPELTSFILPGGGAVSAHLHVARTLCRRCERLVVALADKEDVSSEAIRYLNRLSDALFVFGRWAAKTDGEPEPLWVPKG